MWNGGLPRLRHDLKGKEKQKKELEGGTRRRRRIKMKKRRRIRISGPPCRTRIVIFLAVAFYCYILFDGSDWG
jgi:hypothetical protein